MRWNRRWPPRLKLIAYMEPRRTCGRVVAIPRKDLIKRPVKGSRKGGLRASAHKGGELARLQSELPSAILETQFLGSPGKSDQAFLARVEVDPLESLKLSDGASKTG